MFLALGLLVFPSELGDVWVEGTVLTLMLVFVARPRPRAGGDRARALQRARAHRARWAGLRGAVPVVLATFPVIDERRGRRATFFNIVFFAVVISTLLQGSTSSGWRAGSA